MNTQLWAFEIYYDLNSGRECFPKEATKGAKNLAFSTSGLDCVTAKKGNSCLLVVLLRRFVSL